MSSPNSLYDYYNLLNKKKRIQPNPHSEASLTVDTGGEVSYTTSAGGGNGSERDLLLPRPTWISRTISYDYDNGNHHQHRCARHKRFVRTFMLVVLVSLASWGLWCGQQQQHDAKQTYDEKKQQHFTNHKKKQSSDTSNVDATQQWWEISSQIPSTHIVLDDNNPKTLIENNNHPHTLRWGILGPGRIALDFTTALRMAGCHVQAVAAGSLPRTMQRAQDFANTYEIPHAHASYQDMANDPTVDIVYVATTNQLHAQNVIQMIQAGKNVLVEKPMAVTFAEAQAMAQAAQQAQRFLMVNFWTRFFPIYNNFTLPLLMSSVPQQPRLVSNGSNQYVELTMRGDFGFPAPPRDTGSQRLLQRSLGGGAILDLGCYLISLAVMAAEAIVQDNSDPATPKAELPKPRNIQATASNVYEGESYQVDTETSFALQWNSQVTEKKTYSFLMTGQVSFRRPSSFEVELTGSSGRVLIHRPANAPHSATLYQHELPYGPVTAIEYAESTRVPFNDAFGPEQYPEAPGFMYVIQAIERCMAEYGIPGRQDVKHGHGCLELPELPMSHQLMTAEITEEIMRKIGYFSNDTIGG